MNENNKIYVAGHNGLVGSAIWKNLQSRGYINLIGRSHSELDLMDSGAVKDFFDKEKPDYVILAAAYVGGIMANNIYRADFIYRNLQIQNNVIGESFRHRVRKLLFLGSSCIYPKEAPQPINEEDLLTSTLEYTNEPYAIAKIAGLKMCESFNIQYGTNYIAVMPTNLYGPNDSFDLEKSHVLPALIRKMHMAKCMKENNWSGIQKDLRRRSLDGLDGRSTIDDFVFTLNKIGIFSNHLELWGTGKPMREFLWSEDLADACVFILENVNFEDLKKGKEEVRNCHINIGTGREISIKDLALLTADIVGYTGRIKFNPLMPDGTMRKLTDVSKLKSLGWQYKVELDEGIRRMYQWYISDQEENECENVTGE
ncbi:MAG: GDP-L-fucose synthase [Proteiniphilum sp.]|uniref:GDP-L-fucose synthase family protein n=1 Tax=Proteiniphilum sp. TaxID=1926877 RepID=UPI002B217671|nr:GDP-L-fucose synthase [Proteiniphilum sp.]MEA5126979.1 GDP-L-fucose synthase [Proteiniphilum sp.]